jgi:hypothetical protein
VREKQGGEVKTHLLVDVGDHPDGDVKQSLLVLHAILQVTGEAESGMVLQQHGHCVQNQHPNGRLCSRRHTHTNHLGRQFLHFCQHTRNLTITLFKHT